MKSKTIAVFIGITLLLNLILLSYTMTLEKNISSLQNNLSGQINQLRMDILNISGNVSSTLEEQASILDSAEWSYGKINVQNLMVPFSVSVIPKEADTDTTAILTANGQSVPMVRSGMSFNAEISVGLFEDINAYVTFDVKGTQRTQSLNVGQRPFEGGLIELHAQNTGGSSYEANSGQYTLDGNVDIDLMVPENSVVSSLKIVTTDNGTVIQDMALNPALPHQTAEYKLEIKLETDHVYETAVEATDNNELTYRTIVDRAVANNNGSALDFGEISWWDNMMILNQNGGVLYDPTATYN